jgi:hypothetical protein
LELTLVMLLLPAVESVTCSWSMPAEALTENEWFEEFAQVTCQEVFTGVAVDCTRDVFWTVTGFVLPVVQSPGRLSVNVVSAITGVTGPLLWSVALPATVKERPAGVDAGLEADAAATLTSVSAEIAVVALVLAIKLLPVVPSTVCN